MRLGGGGRSAIQLVNGTDAVTAGGGGGGADCEEFLFCGGGGIDIIYHCLAIHLYDSTICDPEQVAAEPQERKLPTLPTVTLEPVSLPHILLLNY